VERVQVVNSLAGTGRELGKPTGKQNKTNERANRQHILRDLTETRLREMEVKAGREEDEAGFHRDLEALEDPR